MNLADTASNLQKPLQQSWTNGLIPYQKIGYPSLVHRILTLH